MMGQKKRKKSDKETSFMLIPAVGGGLKGVLWTLVGLVIGVPVLLAIFSDQGDEEGAFEGLVNLPTTGVLATNQYSGILTALIVLIPLGIVGFFTFRFIENRVMGTQSRKNSTANASRIKYKNISAADLEKVKARRRSRRRAFNQGDSLARAAVLRDAVSERNTRRFQRKR